MGLDGKWDASVPFDEAEAIQVSREIWGHTHNPRAIGTGENESYTPPRYIEMARRVLGAIDLDPASSETAQRVVKAARYFTATDNGLQKEWHGGVWLNSPYSQPLIHEFVTKLIEERSAKRVSSAIMLTHNYTDTSWFHAALEIADAVCFTRGRINFINKDGNEYAGTPTNGQAFFYFGDDAPEFAKVFIEVGSVVELGSRYVRGNQAQIPSDLSIPSCLRPSGTMTANRQRLPNRRGSITFDVKALGLTFTVSASRFNDGSLGEIFLQNHKTNSAAGILRPTAPSPRRWRCNSVAPLKF
jgi:ParB family chromosome partitioning protein